MVSVIDGLASRVVPVTARTTWLLAEVTDGDGYGVGELSDLAPESMAGELVSVLRRRILGRSPRDADSWLSGPGQHWADRGRTRAERLRRRTALGGVASSVADLAARAEGVSLARWLGGAEPSQPIPLYANLNRALRDRTPAAAADLARRAVLAGFRAVKCAPFDHLPVERRADRGMEIAIAVREAIGPDVDLMLDAHHTLAYAEVLRIAPRLAELRLAWLEDAADVSDVDAMRAVRDAVGAPLAGGELVGRVDEVLPALRAGVLDVLMPDVKHAGGPRAALHIARVGIEHGARVSLHNPSGPVATAVSGQVTSLLPAGTPLEFMFSEVPWRSGVIDPAERIDAGWLWLPEGPGLGLGVTREVTDVVGG